MKYLLIGVFALVFSQSAAFAWDGFDAESADLVEITPDAVPGPGETVTITNHDRDTAQDCLVESVKRNKRTIEVVVISPDGKVHTLVMEGR